VSQRTNKVVRGSYITDPLRGYVSITYNKKVHMVLTTGDDAYVTLSPVEVRIRMPVKFTKFLQTDGGEKPSTGITSSWR